MLRLSKLIAAAGVTSRRKAGELIRAGRVRVDGEAVTEPGTQVDPDRSRVEVDGRPVQIERKRYYLLNKPRGPLTTVRDQRGRPTVLDLIGEAEERLYPVGRLDADTEGLLLLTNDGELTYHITHPKHGVEKVYEAEVTGRPSTEALRRLEQGMQFPEGPTGSTRARILGAGRDRSRLELTVHAGRKRMVRRMLQAVGHRVRSLKRTRLGPLTLGGLKPGEWRELSGEEVARLKLWLRRAAAPGEGAEDEERKAEKK